MNFLTRTSLVLLTCCTPALAQHIPPNTLPPPVSPPLVARPDYDPHPPAESPEPVADPGAGDGAGESPEILPPESGLLVTPGHYIAGCVQVPIYHERGPYSQGPRWPGGVIPYEYDGNVSQANRALFDAAMAEVESYAAVDFVPREVFHPSWLHIQNSGANNAPIGLRPGQGIVNILNWNVQYIMVHELFHVLGVYHEQSRTDRDSFVTINFSNICQTCCQDSNGNPAACNFNFDREDLSGTFGVYHFDSIMHYSRTAFTSIPGTDTITVQPAYAAIWQNRIGQRTHSTFGDRSTAMYLYQPSWCKVALINSHPNGPGTWSSPYNNFPDAYNAAPNGGDVVIRSGYYTGLGFRNRPMRIHAPDGGVRIGQ
jgi:hypothetical protein